jgi:glutathione reductase (NADPH)
MTWNFATVNETLETAKHYGYDIPEGTKIDYKHFKETRDAVINNLNGIYERNWNREGIDLVHGRARFVEPKVIEVGLPDGTSARYTAPHILIATGGRPNVPTVPGAEHGITSDGFFEIEELPPKIAVVGAGYIAVELAGVMNATNVETHMFIRGEHFLRKFDPMVQKTMTERYEAAGVKLHRKHQGFKEIKLIRDGKGKDKLIKLINNDGTELEVNEVLWAVGRAPEVEDLQLDIPGVKLNPSGHIIVDEYQNTSVPGVYALGDVTGQAELTPGTYNTLRLNYQQANTYSSCYCRRSPPWQPYLRPSRAEDLQALLREHPYCRLLPPRGWLNRSHRARSSRAVRRRQDQDLPHQVHRHVLQRHAGRGKGQEPD